MSADFDYNQLLDNQQTPFSSRVAAGASLEEIRLGLAAGANPFAGMPSALGWSLGGAFVDQRARIQAFLTGARPDYRIPDAVSHQLYVWLLQWDLGGNGDTARMQIELLNNVRARSSLGPDDHRLLALQAARALLGQSSVPRERLAAVLAPLGDLSAQEVESTLPASVDSWPVLKSLLDRVAPSERLDLWMAGAALPSRPTATAPAFQGGWLIRFLAKGQERPILRMLEYTCGGEWCAQVQSDATVEHRAGLAHHLLCSTDVHWAFNAVQTFPQVATCLFPNGNVAEAVNPYCGTLWYPVLSGYVGQYPNDHKKNRTDERLSLGVWLLAQPQPAINKADPNGTTAFDAWESLAERIDGPVASASVIRVQLVAQLGRQLLELGAAEEWADDQEYRRATPFKHPILRGLQEEAAAQERGHRLALSLPAPTPSAARGPRF